MPVEDKICQICGDWYKENETHICHNNIAKSSQKYTSGFIDGDFLICGTCNFRFHKHLHHFCLDVSVKEKPKYKAEWERVRTDHHEFLYRMKTNGGWLIKREAISENPCMTFIPDAQHEWEIEK